MTTVSETFIFSAAATSRGFDTLQVSRSGRLERVILTVSTTAALTAGDSMELVLSKVNFVLGAVTFTGLSRPGTENVYACLVANEEASQSFELGIKLEAGTNLILQLWNPSAAQANCSVTLVWSYQ